MKNPWRHLVGATLLVTVGCARIDAVLHAPQAPLLRLDLGLVPIGCAPAAVPPIAYDTIPSTASEAGLVCREVERVPVSCPLHRPPKVDVPPTP